MTCRDPSGRPWSLSWIDIGEGLWGEYNPEDLKDAPFLRANLEYMGLEIEDASYCTLAQVGAPPEELHRVSNLLFERLPDNPDDYHRRTMEEWTWDTEAVT